MCACAGLLGLIDELTAGTLIAPAGLPLNPTAEAVAWAEGGAELVPVEAWPVLGVPGASTDTALVRAQGALCCCLACQVVTLGVLCKGMRDLEHLSAVRLHCWPLAILLFLTSRQSVL
jgi:hypothetical protein